MVTLYYLRRFLNFFDGLFQAMDHGTYEVSKEVAKQFQQIKDAFASHENILNASIDDITRKQIMDVLGRAGSDFRTSIYESSFSGQKDTITVEDLKAFTKSTLAHLEHAIRANERKDGLYHAYNLMTLNEDDSVSISYLDEMLEGQVAVLSSGYLSSKENLQVLDSLKNSKLFRDDQYSYILYPYKNLKGFMDRNSVPKSSVEDSKLLKTLLKVGNNQIVQQDINGDYHFNGNFKNASDLKEAIQNLDTKYSDLVSKDMKHILNVFEDVFNHKAFTGRSGTFYGYEGLGSIYWHMVSKLLLAVQECCLKAVWDGENDETVGRLLEHFYEINEGIGVHKSPKLYGAFPTDPYSHTPAGKGAQQPGMTGQVKEDILSRFGELGVFVKKGQLQFDPCLLRKSEFLDTHRTFDYINVKGENASLSLTKDQLAFTYCQTPILYEIGNEASIVIHLEDGSKDSLVGLELSKTWSGEVFKRSGKVNHIKVIIPRDYLK